MSTPLTWRTCVHHNSLGVSCPRCREATKRVDGVPGRILNIGDGNTLTVPKEAIRDGRYVSDIQGSLAKEELEPELSVGTDIPTAIVTLTRLSQACMDQARWFDQQGARANPDAATTWATRGEELLAWIFVEMTPRQIAWELLQIAEEADTDGHGR